MSFFKSFLIFNTIISSVYAIQSREERIAACGENPYPYAYACPNNIPQCDSSSSISKAIANYKQCVELARQTNFAEGEVPTFTNSRGSFTYYYMDGTPVPPGTPIGLQINDPRGGRVNDSRGYPTDILIFDTPEAAREYVRRAAMYEDPRVTVGGGSPGQKPSTNSKSKSPSEVKKEIIDAAKKAASSTASGPSCSGVSNYSPTEEVDGIGSAIKVGDRIMTRGTVGCKAAGDALPASVTKWLSALRVYSAAEERRSIFYTSRINGLKDTVKNLANNPAAANSLQTVAIQVQTELFTFTIENLTERVQIRESFIKAAKEAVELSEKENTKIVETYQKNLIASVEQSLEIAKDACEQTKIVKTCDDSNNSCVEEEQPNPVEGCKEAVTQIPLIRTGKIQDYGNTYLEMFGPSKKLNDKMTSFEDEISELINKVPRSEDSNYDWSSQMVSSIKEMKQIRKEGGQICPSDEATLKMAQLQPGSSEYKAYIKADGLIGLPYKRSEYYKEIIDTINKSICSDKAEILKAQKNLTTLIKFNKALEEVF